MADGSEEVKQAQGAEQPQDDLVLQMVNTMETLQSQMGNIKGGHIAKRANQRIDDVNMVEADALKECITIGEKISAVRATLQEHTNSPANINGCLRGSVDQYLVSFDAQIATLRSKFEDDRGYWNQQVKTAAKFELVHAAKLMEQFKKFQMDFSGCLMPSAYEPKELKDLDNFGDKLQPGQEKFRWPTAADLEKLNLTEPLKLKEIRTKGHPEGYMTAIQLVFEHGVESPLFGDQNANTGPIEHFVVGDEPITSINVWTCGALVYKLEIEQGGSKRVVHNWSECSNQQTRYVPANHSIVGVFGSFQGNSYIVKLGFIVMEN